MFKHCLQHNSTQYWERLLGDSGRDGEDLKAARTTSWWKIQNFRRKFWVAPPPGDPPALLVNIHMDWQTLTRNSSRSDRGLVRSSEPPGLRRSDDFQSWGKTRKSRHAAHSICGSREVKPARPSVLETEKKRTQEPEFSTRLRRAVLPQFWTSSQYKWCSGGQDPGTRARALAWRVATVFCNLNFLLVTCTQVGGEDWQGGLRFVFATTHCQSTPYWLDPAWYTDLTFPLK